MVHSSPWIFTVYTFPLSTLSTKTIRPTQRFQRCWLRRKSPNSKCTASAGMVATTCCPTTNCRSVSSTHRTRRSARLPTLIRTPARISPTYWDWTTPPTQLVMVPSVQTLPLPLPQPGMMYPPKFSVEYVLFVTGFLPCSEENLELHTNGVLNQGSALCIKRNAAGRECRRTGHRILRSAGTRERITATDCIPPRAHRQVGVGHHELIVIGAKWKPVERRIHLLDQVSGGIRVGIPI